MWEETFDDVEFEGEPRGLAFSLPLLKERIDPIAVFIIITTSAFIIIVALKLRMIPLWVDFLQSNRFLRMTTYPLLASLTIIVSGIVFRTFLWLRYKPAQLSSGEGISWPRVSVIMAAFNEEELIGKAIGAVFASNYPKDKLEVIAVNDGSTDLTLRHMLKARWEHGGNLKIISFNRNLGKRRALYSGFKVARGEVVVTVDADGKIGRSALRNLVIPLLKDKKVAAVAGRVAVLNERENFLTRMLSIRYSISFDFGRAYQSTYGTVFVCPGALTAYRTEVLRPLIKEWVNQRFMDAPCRHGEDRALTTLILRAGYMTRYQSNAAAYTKVPSGFRRMNQMYIRWTRSYLRESILFSRFMFSRYRTKNRLLPVLDFLFLNFLPGFHIFSIGLVSYSFFVQPIFVLGHLAFLVMASFFLSLYYLRTNRSWVFLYGVPYALITAFFLWWVVPFSAVTLKNQSWLTR
jgi:hyaluronan synthase